MLYEHFLRPPRKPMTLEEVKKSFKYDSVKDTGECHWCDGTGRAYRFEDRDVIEGYKLAEKKPCLNCNATGRIPFESVLTTHKKDIAKYNKEVDSFNFYAKMLKEIRSKLNEEERGLLGLNNTPVFLKSMEDEISVP